jgi:hypothetical protein
MFYEENAINKLLICAHCNRKLMEPKLLPCGKSICKKCAESMVERLENDNQDRLKCLYCTRGHLVPEGGFPSCEILEALLDAKPCEIYRSSLTEELKGHLENMKLKMNEMNESFENGIDKIKERCAQLRNDVQLKSECLADELNKLSETMQLEIEQYERDCIDSFKSSVKVRSELKKSMNEKEEFYESTRAYLAQLKIDDAEVKKKIDLAKLYLANVDQMMFDLKDAMFKKNYLMFFESNTKLNPSVIGELKGIASKFDSIILNEKQKIDLFNLCQLLITQNWRLLYRASSDGKTAQAFHSRCDHQPKTLTIIRTSSGYVFGGYTAQAWDSSGVYKVDPNAFLFSLVNPSSTPTLLKVLNNGTNAIFCNSGYGPTFGGGHDFHISYSSNCYSNLGSSFTTSGITYNTSSAQSYLAGSYNFQYTEIEVFTSA